MTLLDANTSSMQRVSECESVVFCFGGGQPAGLAAAKTSLSIQKVFDCKGYKPAKEGNRHLSIA
jgi:hypothetical protein